MHDSIEKIKYPELFFGFVAPIGADLDTAVASFRDYFSTKNYRVVEIKATEIFSVLEKYVPPKEPLDRSSHQKRYDSYIAYGNQLRERFDNDAIIATTTIRRIMARRLRVQKDEDKFSRTVYLLHQFKRKEEIDLFRSVYGQLFFQISIYSRRGTRIEYLANRFAASDHAPSSQGYRPAAEQLIQKDENEIGATHGQRVASIFHDADLIINTDADKNIEDQIKRFCELLFGSNSISPSRSEYGLFLARAAALRTLDLSRQVGAAIFAPSGEIIALGSNEVPKANGGTYWAPESEPPHFDDRDYIRKIDSNQERKREMFAEIVSLINPGAEIEKLLLDRRIQDCQFMDALEYGRIVHAEMSALMDAARLGHSVKDATLYCTTFPCHMCAKHIVASGVRKVIFLEPYPKSLASKLHSDSISIEGQDRGHYHKFPSVEFEHFYGVSPRRYRDMFYRAKRKDNDTGKFLPYISGAPVPNISIIYPSYANHESYVTDGAMKEIRKVVADNEIANV